MAGVVLDGGFGVKFHDKVQILHDFMTDTNSYQKAGVSIDAGRALISRILPRMEAAAGAALLPGIGGFAAAFRLPTMRQPVLVACADGVGTKTLLLAQHNLPRTAGHDVVAMCINDLICAAARPLFFLDYYACDSLQPDFAAQVIDGVMEACEMADCALIGGETAEMPDVYLPKTFDLAGFAVGVAEESEMHPPNSQHGDVLIALASSGAHSNGYSLIRRIMANTAPPPPILELLLQPTRIYSRSIIALRAVCEVRGLAHITGGGLPENLPRALPSGGVAHLDMQKHPLPPLFAWLQDAGQLSATELRRVFNCGIGMVAAVPAAAADKAVACLQAQGEDAWQIGEVVIEAGGAESDSERVVFAV